MPCASYCLIHSGPVAADATLREWAEPYIAEAGALIAMHGSGASSSEA
jgi:hypothetical protein